MTQENILQLPIEEAPFCIIDVETTGLSPARNGIIEIAMVKVFNFKIVDQYNSFVNPGKEIPYFITQLTGITNDDVFNAPFFGDIVDEVTDFVSDEIIAGHNFSFDLGFLRKEYRYCGRDFLTNLNFCTLKIARRLYPFLRSKSLGTVVNHLRLNNSSSHRALGDAEVTARAFIKMAKELKNNYQIKTVNDLINFQQFPKSLQFHNTKVKKKLGEDVSALPDAPGIYYFLNSRDEIIYIGKAKSLKSRVKSYFSSAAPRKAKKIVQQGARLKIEITNSELTALLAEAESIKVLKPKHNTLLKEYGDKYFLRINILNSFPVPEICNNFDFDGNDYFGLFISRKKAAAVLDMINRTFALRECSEAEFSKERKCFLAEIERCTAPCINKERTVYTEELNKVYEFLYGKSQFALNRLLIKMKEYSNDLKYEKAAEVKEIIDLILSQIHKSSLLAEPVNLANVLFEIVEGNNHDYIVMLTGKIFIKKYVVKEKDYFEDALDDYFDMTINRKVLPDEEDLEKIKITLNWLVKNRNKVRIYYLKDYRNKQELYSKLSSFNSTADIPEETYFDVKFLIDNFQKEKVAVEEEI